ncbi:MAG: hypothetical protein GY804_00345 [Alphaproteobacteria bacterium]|nr:hypothetical protein [Alphaproteobacteria bacterium]
MYYCLNCEKQFSIDEVDREVIDNTFYAPYGDLMVTGGNIGINELCPKCGDELEEAVE